MSEEMVTITKKEYDNLIKDSTFLGALEEAGVDNWQGIDIAIDMINERDPTFFDD
jgi:hypothetical protein